MTDSASARDSVEARLRAVEVPAIEVRLGLAEEADRAGASPEEVLWAVDTLVALTTPL